MAPQQRRIGELLRDMGLINQNQLDEAVKYQQEWKHRMKFGETLVALSFITETDLAKALSKIYRIPYLDLANVQIPQEVTQLIPQELIERKQMIPVRMVEMRGRKTITVAMADPSSMHDLQQLEFSTGCKVMPALATGQDITDAITRNYRRPGGVGELNTGFSAFGMRELGTSPSFDLKENNAEPVIQKQAPPTPGPSGKYETMELELDLATPRPQAPGGNRGYAMGHELSLSLDDANANEISLELELDPQTRPARQTGLKELNLPPLRQEADAAERRVAAVPKRRDGMSQRQSGAPALPTAGGQATRRAPAPQPEIRFQSQQGQRQGQPQQLARIQTLKVTNPLAADGPTSQEASLKSRLDKLERNVMAIYMVLRRKGIISDDDLDLE